MLDFLRLASEHATRRLQVLLYRIARTRTPAFPFPQPRLILPSIRGSRRKAGHAIWHTAVRHAWAASTRPGRGRRSHGRVRSEIPPPPSSSPPFPAIDFTAQQQLQRHSNAFVQACEHCQAARYERATCSSGLASATSGFRLQGHRFSFQHDAGCRDAEPFRAAAPASMS